MKCFRLILMLALLFNTALARDTSDVSHSIQVVDEVGQRVTTISSVNIYLPDTTTSQTIYKSKNRQNAIDLPMSSSSTNTTLSDGFFEWYGQDGWDFTITDGNNTVRNATHRTRTSSEGTLVFPTYLTSLSTTDFNDDQDLSFGDDGDWVANGGTTDDRMTWTPVTDGAQYWIGSTSFVSDVNVFGATAGRDLMWDASRNQLSFRDSAILGFGGAAAEDAADFTMYHTAASGILTITAVSADEAVHIGDGSIATDFLIQNTSFPGADIWWDDSANRWDFGSDDDGVDVNFAADTSGDFLLFDTSVGDLIYEDVNCMLMDNTFMIFGDDDDFLFRVTSATQFDITTLLTDETAAMDFGADTFGIDVNLFAAATGDFVRWDSSAGDLIFEDANCMLMDNTWLIFGDNDDILFRVTSATQFDITTLLTNETFAIDYGASTEGIDVNVFGAAGVVLFDASADKMIFEAIDIHVMDDDLIVFGDGSDATLQYDEDSNDAVQWTGTVFGAKDLVVVNAVDDSNEVTVLALMSGVTYVADGNTADPNTHYSLPTAVAGYRYTFIDANTTANHEVWVTAASGDTIDGGTANKSMKADGTDPGESITLLAVDTTRWFIVDVNGTWAHDNN